MDFPFFGRKPLKPWQFCDVAQFKAQTYPSGSVHEYAPPALWFRLLLTVIHLSILSATGVFCMNSFQLAQQCTQGQNKQVLPRVHLSAMPFGLYILFRWKKLVLGNDQIPSPCFILQITVVYKWLFQPSNITWVSVLIQQKDSKCDNVEGLHASRDKQIALRPLFPFSFNVLR